MQFTPKLTANQIPRSNNKIVIAYDIETVPNQKTWWIKFQQTLKRYTALTPVNNHLSETPRLHTGITRPWITLFGAPQLRRFRKRVQSTTNTQSASSRSMLKLFFRPGGSINKGVFAVVVGGVDWQDIQTLLKRAQASAVGQYQCYIEQACKKNYSELGKNETNSVSHMQ